MSFEGFCNPFHEKSDKAIFCIDANYEYWCIKFRETFVTIAGTNAKTDRC
jgi:hypothetical protein